MYYMWGYISAGPSKRVPPGCGPCGGEVQPKVQQLLP